MVLARSAKLRDNLIRAAAFGHVRKLYRLHGYLTAGQLKEGFIFEGTRIRLDDPRRGIWKPRQMLFLLSIKTVLAKGTKIRYDDQRSSVFFQLFEQPRLECVDYAFMGKDPRAPNNVWLREAVQHRIPLIYFIRFEAVYFLHCPVFLSAWQASELKVKVVFGEPDQELGTAPPQTAPERRYALRLGRMRLHQASFRKSVIEAYQGRCALSGLPEPLLLDAAHIVADKDERFGQPVVPNGIPLSKTHHAAFDSHLIGIDPCYRLHISDRLLSKNDGPMLKALQNLKGQRICLPQHRSNYPDRERLAQRFEDFKATS